MKKVIPIFLLSFALLSNIHAREIITGTETEQGAVLDKKGIVILNEELRQYNENIKDNEEDIDTNEADITTNESAITTINALIKTTATANSVYQSGADTYLPDDTVDTTALKTALGTVSQVQDGGTHDKSVTGGEYCFFPTIYGSAATTAAHIRIAGVQSTARTFSTAHVTSLMLYPTTGGTTIYAATRYVTASGKDYWVFLLVNKITGEISSASAAPDHPSYGNGGDSKKVPHPFNDYDKTKYKIAILDKETCNQLKQESKDTGESILVLVHEEYKPNMSKKEKYVPLHSGKFLGQKPVLIETIPDYISVRKLIRLTEEEKEVREMLKEAHRIANEEKKEEKKQNRTEGKNNLKAGKPLTEIQIEALFN